MTFIPTFNRVTFTDNKSYFQFTFVCYLCTERINFYRSDLSCNYYCKISSSVSAQTKKKRRRTNFSNSFERLSRDQDNAPNVPIERRSFLFSVERRIPSWGCARPAIVRTAYQFVAWVAVYICSNNCTADERVPRERRADCPIVFALTMPGCSGVAGFKLVSERERVTLQISATGERTPLAISPDVSWLMFHLNSRACHRRRRHRCRCRCRCRRVARKTEKRPGENTQYLLWRASLRRVDLAFPFNRS